MAGSAFPAVYDNPSYALTGLIATGSTQADALPLSAAVNVFSTVPFGAGCILPAGLGKLTIVNNDPTNALLLYPNLGDRIGALGINVSASIAPGTQVTYTTASPPLQPAPRIWQGLGQNIQNGGTINGGLSVTGSLSVGGQLTATAFAGGTLAAGAITGATIQTNGGFVLGSVAPNVIAAGSAYAGATPLTAQINNITTAAVSSGAVLPPSAHTFGGGGPVLVLNNGTAAVMVYGAVNFPGHDSIDGTSGTIGVTLSAGHRCFFTALAPGAYVSGPEGGVTS
jgi:hypothetical protein